MYRRHLVGDLDHKDAVYLIECVRLILYVSESSVMSMFAHVFMQLYAYLSNRQKRICIVS